MVFLLFANPFEAVTVVKNVPVHLQMELVDLQCDGDLKNKFAEVPLVKFYGKCIPHDKCPVLVNHAFHILFLIRFAENIEQIDLIEKI